MENQKKIVVIGLIVCMVGVLLGLVLPWFVYLDLFSVMMGVAVIRGWNSFLVLLPGLISIILAWVALRKDDPKGWFYVGCKPPDRVLGDDNLNVGYDWLQLVESAGTKFVAQRIPGVS